MYSISGYSPSSSCRTGRTSSEMDPLERSRRDALPPGFCCGSTEPPSGGANTLAFALVVLPVKAGLLGPPLGP